MMHQSRSTTPTSLNHERPINSQSLLPSALKSHSITFLEGCSASLSQFGTKPEFRVDANHLFHKKANLFALAIISLLTPKKENEALNFIPIFHLHHKKITEISLLEKLVFNLRDVPPQMMHDNLSNFGAQNLGALTLLNLLMSSEMTGESLGIAFSPESEQCLFTQKPCNFWVDYFVDSESDHLFSHERSFQDKLKRFTLTPSQTTWWAQVLAGDSNSNSSTCHINLQALFLNEIFQVALRIFLTDDLIFEKIAAHLLNGEDERFVTYFKTKIMVFKRHFHTLLSSEEYQQWASFLADEGLETIQHYQNDLTCWHIGGEALSDSDLNRVNEYMVVTAASTFGIDDLISLHPMHVFAEYSAQNKILFFDYLLDCNIRNLSHIECTPYARADFEIFDNFLAYLNHDIKNNDLNIQDIMSTKNEIDLYDLLIHAIEYHKNNCVELLLSINPKLMHTPMITKDHPIANRRRWDGHSLLYFAKKYKNLELSDYLEQQGAVLLEREKKSAIPDTTTLFRPQAIRTPQFNIDLLDEPNSQNSF